MQFIRELFKGTSDLIEIREIQDTSKQLFFNSETIKDYIPPEDKNIYFGVYARKTRLNGKANNCTDTRVLWCDIDSFDRLLSVPERVEDIKARVKAAGLPNPSILLSSGNGIHLYWLLNKRVDKGVIEFNKVIANLLNGDIRATDKARVLRLPNTLNVKNKDKLLKCEIIQANYGLVFDISDFYTLLGKYIPKEIKECEQEKKTNKSDILNSLVVDRPCVREMLKGVPEGERNFALGRITKWLQIKGKTKAKAKEIVIEWNKLNNPPEDKFKLVNNFYKYWKEDYKLLGCLSDNPQLQQVLYKYCSKPDCNLSSSIGGIKLNNSIGYNNRLLSKLDKLTGNDLIVYGVLLRHKEGLTTSLLIDKLTNRGLKTPCMSNTTRIKSLQTLKKQGFIEVVEGIVQNGIENLYKAIPQGNYGLGYTVMSNGSINGAIDKRVTSGQFRLYVLLMRYAFNKGNCYPSLNTLAKELRVTSECISLTLRELEKSDYIKKSYTYTYGKEQLFFSLLV